MSRTAASKVTDTAAENVEYAAFEAGKTNDQFRAIAERSAEQSKEVFARMKTGAETAQKALETSMENAKSVSGEISRKSIAAMRSNSEATYSHFEALLGAKTFSEVMELQTSFLRERFEAAVEQGKDLQAVASKAAEDAARPMRDMVATSAAELKVA